MRIRSGFIAALLAVFTAALATPAHAADAPAAGAWTVDADGANTYGGRYLPNAAYDEAHNNLVVFGGTVMSPEGDFTNVASTSLWNGTAWASYPGTQPPGRSFAQMTYDPAHSQIVLFGGMTDGGLANDTWTFDGLAWHQETPATSPPARGMGSMSVAGGKVVLFGGFGAGGNNFGDTWTWDGTNWTQVAGAAPSPRMSFGFGEDRATGTAVLFGGQTAGSDADLQDTWVFDGAAWSHKTTPAAPAARIDSGEAFDPIDGLLTLFGGVDSAGNGLTDVWTWDGSRWTQKSTTSTPDPLDGEAFVFAGNTGTAPGRLVTLGGEDPDGNLLTSTRSVAFEPAARIVKTAGTFAAQPLGFVGGADEKIRNAGSSLDVPQGIISGPAAGDYSLSSDSCSGTSLAGGAECTVHVSFSPHAAGTRAATLSFGSVTFPLSAVGQALGVRTPGVASNGSVNSSFPVYWDSLHGAYTYDVEWAERVKSSSGAYVQGPWHTWKSGATGTSSWFGGSGSVASTPGHTYLFHARPRAGEQVGSWTSVASAVVPVDDRSSWIGFGSGWSNVASSGRYYGTLRQTASAAKTATIRTDTNTFYVVAERCTTCGQIKLYVDGAYAGTADTYGKATGIRQVVWSKYVAGGIKTHTLRIVTVGTAHRPAVKIDAIGFAR